MDNEKKLNDAIANASNIIGKVHTAKEWFLIDQDRINQFADATNDHQFIHIDSEAAKLTPWGSTIAHGFLVLSLVTPLTTGLIDIDFDMPILMALNYGTNKVRFINPVKVDSKIRATSKIISLTPKPEKSGILVTAEITIEIEGENKPALVMEALSLIILNVN